MRIRVTIAISIVLMIVAGVYAWVLYIGAGQYRRTDDIVRPSRAVRQAVEFYSTKHDTSIIDFKQALGSVTNPSQLINPYTGCPVHPVDEIAVEYLGEFSCFPVEVQDEEHFILVTYAERARLPEVIYGSFIIGKPHGDTEMGVLYGPGKTTGPCLVWIGGSCANNEQWLARGISPAELPEYLERRSSLYSYIKAAGGSGTEEGR